MVMNNILSDRHRGLLRATLPAMIRPSTTLLEHKGGGYPKRFYRQLKTEYIATHNILGEISFQVHFTPDLLIRAVHNYERA